MLHILNSSPLQKSCTTKYLNKMNVISNGYPKSFEIHTKWMGKNVNVKPKLTHRDNVKLTHP